MLEIQQAEASGQYSRNFTAAQSIYEAHLKSYWAWLAQGSVCLRRRNGRCRLQYWLCSCLREACEARGSPEKERKKKKINEDTRLEHGRIQELYPSIL